MREAMNQALRINPNLPITASRKVVDTRNFVIHAYDSLKPDILWGIVVNHMPLLKQEIEALLNGWRSGKYRLFKLGDNKDYWIDDEIHKDNILIRTCQKGTKYKYDISIIISGMSKFNNQ